MDFTTVASELWNEAKVVQVQNDYNICLWEKKQFFLPIDSRDGTPQLTAAFWWLWSYCTGGTVHKRKRSHEAFVSKAMTSVWPLWCDSLLFWCFPPFPLTQTHRCTHCHTHGLVVLLMLAHLCSGTRAASLAMITALSFPCKHQPTSPCIPIDYTYHREIRRGNREGMKKLGSKQVWAMRETFFTTVLYVIGSIGYVTIKQIKNCRPFKLKLQSMIHSEINDIFYINVSCWTFSNSCTVTP